MNAFFEKVARYYRYGFQGQEKDDEIKGEGNSVNYKYRMHDPRIGRFFAVDPLTSKYPHYTPYSFSGNRVIDMVELEGLEPAAPPGMTYGGHLSVESATGIIARTNYFIYEAMIWSPNFKPTRYLDLYNDYHLNGYTAGVKRGFSALRGVAGEGVFAQGMDGQGATMMIASTWGSYSVKFNTSIFASTTGTWDVKWRITASKSTVYDVAFNNADGTYNYAAFNLQRGGSVNMYFEVKTLRSNSFTFMNIKKGFKQSISTAELLKGIKGKDYHVSVLVVDKAAWDYAYARNSNKMDRLLNKLSKAGGSLWLKEGLTSDAESGVCEILNATRRAEENNQTPTSIEVGEGAGPVQE